MASPQREDGHLDIANELAEAFARLRLNGSQSSLVWVILRRTYGWNKKMDTIGLMQFVEATGLSKKLVSRELQRLASRNIIVVWGDNNHAKQYGIQKDYSRWIMDEDTKVSPKWGTPAEHKVSPKKGQSVPQSVDKVSPIWGTTNTSNTSKTIPNGIGASAPHDSEPAGTLLDRYERKYREASNRIAVIGELFSVALGSAPDYRRLGAMSKRLNSGGRLMALIVDASKQHITDDPHDYLAKMVSRAANEPNGARPRQADHNSAARGKVVI